MQKMKIGDKVTFFKPHWSGFEVWDDIEYTIVEIDDKWLKLKHPEIEGHFTFKKEQVNRVIPKK